MTAVLNEVLIVLETSGNVNSYWSNQVGLPCPELRITLPRVLRSFRTRPHKRPTPQGDNPFLFLAVCTLVASSAS